MAWLRYIQHGAIPPHSQGGSPINTDTVPARPDYSLLVLSGGEEVRGVILESTDEYHLVGVGDMMPRRISRAIIVHEMH